MTEEYKTYKNEIELTYNNDYWNKNIINLNGYYTVNPLIPGAKVTIEKNGKKYVIENIYDLSISEHETNGSSTVIVEIKGMKITEIENG